MKDPILILAFNRPNETENLINKLAHHKPLKIYFNQDGPRENNKYDKKLCAEVLNIVDKKINWNVEIKKKINKKNMGLKKSVESGIDWFFKNEEFGIILEDDCSPNTNFFNFCSQMLIDHMKNEKIFSISGSNFIHNKFNIEEDFFYSKYAHCWGWATWKRAWVKYDGNLNGLFDYVSSNKWKTLHENILEQHYWINIFKKVHHGKINSWAFPWLFSIWKNDGLNIIPSKNFVENIGFGPNATNTFSYDKKFFYQTFDEKFIVKKYPKKNIANKKADKAIFEIHFKGKYNFWPWKILYFIQILFEDPKTFFLKIKKKIYD